MTDKDAMDNIKALHCGDYNCQLPDNELDSPDFWCKSKNCEGCFDYLCYTALQERIARQQSDHSGSANKNVDDNPPLTLKELRGMDGDPVWIEPMGQWRIVHVDRDSGFVRLYTVYNTISAKGVLNNGGRIYRRKPEEG